MSKKDTLDSELIQTWLGIDETIKEEEKLNTLLYDKATGLPTLPLFMKRIKQILSEHNRLGILCVNVVKYTEIEELYGWKVFDKIMREIAKVLTEMTGLVMREDDIVSLLMVSGNAFVIVLSPSRLRELTQNDVSKVKTRLIKYLDSKFRDQFFASLRHNFSCYVGASLIKANKDIRIERLVYNGLEEAFEDSNYYRSKDVEIRSFRLKDIIKNEDIHIVFQPVVDLLTHKVFAYEALSRGPAYTEFENPSKMFKVAYEAGLVLDLERLCRKKIFQSINDLKDDYLLFVNIEPESVADSRWRQITSSGLLVDIGISPERIVLEITERCAIADFASFRSALKYFRSLGFKVSVDDAGAGYGSLEAIAEIKPDFIKMDMSLIRGVHQDQIRQQLVKIFVLLAENTGIELVVEGIETSEELRTLVDLGVKSGQGYFFAYPNESFVEVESMDWVK
ncbi:MAG: EAL domain-containing protein [Actinobacteria bacterium]|nr:EAL domain-containing protein [Actinomycetota bacterium]